MKSFLINIRKGCCPAFSRLFVIALVYCYGACSSSGDNPEIKPPINIEPVTPIDEFYKELNFTTIAAHRCYFRTSPENSLAAIEDALELGIEFLETDTQTTADGVVVLFHDSTVDRMTNGSGLVANMNFGNLSNLKLKNNRNGGVLTEETIPTLEQALLKIRGRNIYMHLEVKDKNFSEVVTIIKKVEMEDQVVVFADTRDDYDILDTFVGIFIDPVCRTSEEFNFYLNRTNTPILNLAGTQFIANNTQTAKNNNKLTWRGITGKDEDIELISGATSTPNLNTLIAIDPSIIHTDYADLLMAYLESKDKR
ncbi:glycerophosphodiester phosphodiesterase family protein [Aestuariivivens sediminis]|uniref:glycerophosphodiester phosphodiesterase family protein n=1 Tax=Aestuariivivens sediminis TaxID=2913557 RepID=UPI001F594F8F|nr:glycerophosphodiester phosphodiesterase family protein [Aestuariivivens sediminis]